jgi:hypothetical protein
MFHGLHFSAHSTLDLCAYSDFDWAGDPTDHHFTIGFCFFLGDSLISWHSKKQHIVSHSSTEAEYRVLANTTSEFLAFHWLLEDMGLTIIVLFRLRIMIFSMSAPSILGLIVIYASSSFCWHLASSSS